MKLPLGARKDAILVVCDRLSKMTHFVATTDRIFAERLARLFKDNVWKLCGLLESVISDRRPQFPVELMKELNKVVNIISSTNQWSNKKNESRARTISIILCQ